MVKLFGRESAAEFGPLKLAAVRQSMIAGGLARKNINRTIGRLKHVFKWATEREMIPPAVYQGISTVIGLKAGRSDAKETEPVKPVAEEHVEAILPHVAPPVAAILKLGLLTGARPGELCSMRGCDIDTTGKLWVYRPAKHKTAHHGHGREIYLGERGQEIVRPFLKADMTAHLFSPADAMQWHREQRRQARKTPLSCGNSTGTNRKAKPARTPGDHYCSVALARAITAGCDRAFPAPPEIAADLEKLKAWRRQHRFHAHQLRHTAGTRFRKEHGLEVSSLLLGHKHVAVTEIYAERNVAAAQNVMAAVG
jgi:integrase